MKAKEKKSFSPKIRRFFSLRAEASSLASYASTSPTKALKFPQAQSSFTGMGSFQPIRRGLSSIILTVSDHYVVVHRFMQQKKRKAWHRSVVAQRNLANQIARTTTRASIHNINRAISSLYNVVL